MCDVCPLAALLTSMAANRILMSYVLQCWCVVAGGLWGVGHVCGMRALRQGLRCVLALS